MKKSILCLLLFISTSVISFATNPKSSSSILNTIINPIYAIQDTTINKTKDPFNVIEHTLSNGLKVYLAINENEPRIQTMVAIKTGSKNDPKEVTGLAHYLEHMLFKGTSKMGALDWDKENPLLVQISNQYELYRHEKDETKRKEIYKKIDALSQEAAKYVATNEYDNLSSSLGAKGTNAYTSNERTVYINDIPSNELDRWMAIESERFGELVLRLFHTELEAVYEEFNRGQDSDSRLVYQTVLEKLFKKHTYGTQSTIGLGAHLQNPSMVKIHEYFDQYYVPNNMAIILAGDLDPEATIQMIEKYFGHFTPKPVTQFSCEREDPITEPIVVDVLGTDAEFINITFRIEGGMQSKDRMYLQLMDMMLNNGDAGLIDLNLTKKQLVLRAGSYPRSLNDYSIFTMNGTPRDGQSLEELKELLLGELDKIKNGSFDEWLIPAVVKQLKLQEIRTSESNRGIASSVLDAFISEIDWKEEYQYLSRMSTITKDEMVAWANKTFTNNYVVVNKRKGDKKTYKVEKPNITEIPVNRGKPSSFATHISNMPSSRMTPNFVDYDKEIQRDHLI
ncbi:MAG: insulinase family protein, partial [Bacteroidetes bacterium]|nr:insulinase family protein [Bacteroidota bacterium]